MDKIELIQALEGKYILIPDGTSRLVRDGKVQTNYGEFRLLNYSTGQLEIMAKYALATAAEVAPIEHQTVGLATVDEGQPALRIPKGAGV